MEHLAISSSSFQPPTLRAFLMYVYWMNDFAVTSYLYSVRNLHFSYSHHLFGSQVKVKQFFGFYFILIVLPVRFLFCLVK